MVAGLHTGEYQHTTVNLMAGNGTVAAGSNTTWAGKQIEQTSSDAACLQNMHKGEQFEMRRFSRTLNETVVTVGAPVEIGVSGQKWMVNVNISLDEAMAAGHRLVLLPLALAAAAGAGADHLWHNVAGAAHADDERSGTRGDGPHAPADRGKVNVDGAAARLPRRGAQEGCEGRPRDRLAPPPQEGAEEHRFTVGENRRPARAVEGVTFETRLAPRKLVAFAPPPQRRLGAHRQFLRYPGLAEVVHAPRDERGAQHSRRPAGDDRHPAFRQGPHLQDGHDEKIDHVIRERLGGGQEMKRASPERSPYSFAQDRVAVDEVDRRWPVTSCPCSQSGPSWP
jgi:hypothetical protein